MIHIAIDLHRNYCRVKSMDDVTGEILLEETVPSEKEALLDCLRPFQDRGPMRIVMETCGFAGYWADTLDPFGDVAVLHAREVAARRGSKRKNDRRDTDLLLRLSRTDDLPRAHLGTTAARDWKNLLCYRVGLVRVGTRLRVRLRNVAQRYGTRLEASDVNSAKGRALRAQFGLREHHRLIVDQLLEVLAEVDQRVVAVETQIGERAAQCAPARTVEVLDGDPRTFRNCGFPTRGAAGPLAAKRRRLPGVRAALPLPSAAPVLSHGASSLRPVNPRLGLTSGSRLTSSRNHNPPT